MKKIVYLLIALIVLSCSKEIEVQPNFKASSNKSIKTRAIVDKDNYSTSNPQLLENWENLTDVVLNSSGAFSEVRVSLPWINGSISNLPLSMSDLLKKEDGWDIVFHTFKEKGLDKYQNYLVFYNKFSGVLRVYYYNENIPEANNNFLWIFQTMNGTPSHILENFSYPTKNFNTQSNVDKLYMSNFSSENISSLGNGWNGFEINISYNKISANQLFAIKAVNKNISNISLAGSMTGTIDGKIISTSSRPNEAPSGIVNGVANLAGDAAKDYIDSALGKGSKVSPRIKNLITEIPKTGYASAIKSGLNLILGSILGVKLQTTEQDVKLAVNTKMTMEGTLNYPSVAAIAPINNINLSETFGTEHIGAWNIVRKPKIEAERYSPVEVVREMSDGRTPEKGDIVVGDLAVNWPFLHIEQPQIIVNPNIEKYLVDQKVSYNIVISHSPHNKGYTYNFDMTSLGNGERTNYLETSFSDSQNDTSIKSLRNSWYSFDEVQVNLYGANYAYDYLLSYDWTGMKENGLVMVVTVEQKFNFNGKEIDIISSKHFLVDFSVIPTNSLYPNMWHYVVNQDRFSNEP